MWILLSLFFFHYFQLLLLLLGKSSHQAVTAVQKEVVIQQPETFWLEERPTYLPRRPAASTGQNNTVLLVTSR